MERKAYSSERSNGGEHLIENVGRVGLEGHRTLDLVAPGSGVFKPGCFDRNVDAVRIRFKEFLDWIAFGEVDGADVEDVLGELQAFWHTIDSDDSCGIAELAPSRTEQTDGTESPDGNDIAFLRSSTTAYM